MREFSKKLILLLIAFLLIAAFASCELLDSLITDIENDSIHTGEVLIKPDTPEGIKPDNPESGRIEVHFIDVGQGDAILILAGGEAMLIDAGQRSAGKTVASYLMDLDLLELKYIVGTHPHEDHIGGFSQVMADFIIGTVILPGVGTDTKTYKDFIGIIESMDLNVQYPIYGTQFTLGSAVLTVAGPVTEYNDLNNSSLVIRLDYGDTSFLFTGDSEKEAELDMLEAGTVSEASVLKIGHHGSSTSSCREFLSAVAPRYAVISCGDGNSYGHPHSETLESLEALGVTVFRTDISGSIIIWSDGRVISSSTPLT